MPSLKPNRLRGVACVVDVDDVRPKPSWDQRSAALPKAIRDRLRIACTATCGSSAQACTQRSPSLRCRVEVVGREVRQPPQRRGLPVGETEAVLAVGVAEQRRPEPERQRQPRRRQARCASPVSAGGRVVGQRGAAADRPALRHRGGGGGPGLQQQHQLGAGGRW